MLLGNKHKILNIHVTNQSTDGEVLSTLDIAEGNHTGQPLAIEGRIIEVHNESPNEIRLVKSYGVRLKFVSYNLVFSGHFPLWTFLYDK